MNLGDQHSAASNHWLTTDNFEPEADMTDDESKTGEEARLQLRLTEWTLSEGEQDLWICAFRREEDHTRHSVTELGRAQCPPTTKQGACCMDLGERDEGARRMRSVGVRVPWVVYRNSAPADDLSPAVWLAAERM